jgi:hypothetical protein
MTFQQNGKNTCQRKKILVIRKNFLSQNKIDLERRKYLLKEMIEAIFLPQENISCDDNVLEQVSLERIKLSVIDTKL